MSRAVPSLLLLASVVAAACVPSVRTPSVDGIVKARECRPTSSECPAKEECGTGNECAAVGGAASRLGFVVDDDHVLMYVGSGRRATVPRVWFRVTAPATGAGYNAVSVRGDADTGLALLKIQGEMEPVYEFSRQSVETERTVHAFTEIEGGHLPLVRGVVAAIETLKNRGDDAIVHNARVDKEGYGSPLFNNCGEVVGVVVPAPHDEVLAGQLAVSTKWLKSALKLDDSATNQQRGREPTLRRASGECLSERTRLIREVRLDILYWVLGLTTAVVVLGLVVCYFSTGKVGGMRLDGTAPASEGEKAEAPDTFGADGGHMDGKTTRPEARQTGASPPAGTGGGAK